MQNPESSHAHDGHSHGARAHAHPAPDSLSARLLFSVVINVAITAAQVVGGILAGSLALLSDAAHNASAVLGLVLAYAANRAGRSATSAAGSRPRTDDPWYPFHSR
jgi:cobalt-zinc-cadmium efflux system protein